MECDYFFILYNNINYGFALIFDKRVYRTNLENFLRSIGFKFKNELRPNYVKNALLNYDFLQIYDFDRINGCLFVESTFKTKKIIGKNNVCFSIKFSFFDETERVETIFDLEKILKSCLKPITLEELIKEVQEHYKRNILEAHV